MTAPLPLQQSSDLYEQDYVLWLQATVDQLRQGKLEQIDIPSLIEELEDMGRSEKRALESNLEVLLRHLLKYRYQPERRSNSWRFTILEHRDRCNLLFRDSPSLKPYYKSVFADCYARARRKAAVETGLSIDAFPENAPFTATETLNPDFLPNL
jgi:hypothetical protein